MHKYQQKPLRVFLFFCILLVVMENVIEEKLYENVRDYCEINGLDIKKYINQKLKSALMLDKYGSSPFSREESVEDGKMRQDDIPFIVESEKIDFSGQQELKPEIPMTPDDDFIKEKKEKEKKTPRKNAKEEKEPKVSAGEKIIVNKRILK